MRLSLLLLSMISYNAWMVGKPHLTLGEGIPAIRQEPFVGPEKPYHMPTCEDLYGILSSCQHDPYRKFSTSMRSLAESSSWAYAR
jgi:hypothetical protein